MTDNQASFIVCDMCAPDHEHCLDIDISPLVQVVTIGAAELEALRQQAARVPALEAQVATDKQAMQLFVDENASFEVKLRGNEERIADHEYHLEEAEDPREKIGYKLAWKIEVMSQGFKFILEAFEKMRALQNEVPDPNDRYSLICEKYMDNRYRC